MAYIQHPLQILSAPLCCLCFRRTEQQLLAILHIIWLISSIRCRYFLPLCVASACAVQSSSCWQFYISYGLYPASAVDTFCPFVLPLLAPYRVPVVGNSTYH